MIVYDVYIRMTEPFVILASQRSEPFEPRPRPHLWSLIVLVMGLMVVAVALLGEPSTTVPQATPTTVEEREARIYTISYRFGVFSPTNLRIHVGDTVRWRNDGVLPVRIVAQLQAGQRVPMFDSTGAVQAGSYFSYTFSTGGTFGYHNPEQKTESGVIIVRE